MRLDCTQSKFWAWKLSTSMEATSTIAFVHTSPPHLLSSQTLAHDWWSFHRPNPHHLPEKNNPTLQSLRRTAGVRGFQARHIATAGVAGAAFAWPCGIFFVSTLASAFGSALGLASGLASRSSAAASASRLYVAAVEHAPFFLN